MFNNFDEFKKDFMEKIGDKLPWMAYDKGDRIVITQTKTTEERSYDTDWESVDNEWEEDFYVLRNEIIDAVSELYGVAQAKKNRFVNTSSENSWISEVEDDSYSDYYDCGLRQTINIDLDTLFNVVINR